MSFLEENEVIVVAREKSDQFGTAGGRKTAGIPLKTTKSSRQRGRKGKGVVFTTTPIA